MAISDDEREHLKSMWDYWAAEDEEGIEGALEHFDEVKSDPVIQSALTQIEVGRLTIKARVEQLKAGG